MSQKQLKTNLAEGILTITIDRADKMNALNIALIEELGQAIEEVYENDQIYGAIITGDGEKAFAAGADIAEFANFSPVEGRQMSEKGHAVFNRIEACPKPIVAAVNGFALGGGCELAMACHMRIASEQARFGQPEVNLGIIPGYGGTQRLPLLIGKGKAMELIMTADMVKADEALRLGLVNHVVESGELMAKCEEILQKIFSKGPAAIAGVIRCVNAFQKADGYPLEIEGFAGCFGTDEFKEGTTAFVEKRKASFR